MTICESQTEGNDLISLTEGHEKWRENMGFRWDRANVVIYIYLDRADGVKNVASLSMSIIPTVY